MQDRPTQARQEKPASARPAGGQVRRSGATTPSTVRTGSRKAAAPRKKAGSGAQALLGRFAALGGAVARKAASGVKSAGSRSAAQKKPARGGKADAGKLTPKRIAWRAGLSVLTVIALVLVAAIGAGFVGFRGPSRSLGDLLTVTMLETSALKFVPRIYYSKAEVEEILQRNSVVDDESETDTSMIVVAGPTPEPGEAVEAQAASEPPNRVISEDGIDICEVHGATFNGWMMIVYDPSRVSVGVCREDFNSKPGMRLREIAERYNAVAAINGGGFSDGGGVGNGGKPLGLVIADGQVLNKARVNSDHGVVAGFNQDNVLIVGKLTSEQALEKGIRDALAFGPALVVNGEAAQVSGASSGLNPRTAIGQRADGAVLLLVIDGRQASSLGATYADMITVLLEYGAINAVNMDGGSSSLMYYKGEYLNKGVILTGDRDIPDGFIVR